MTGAFVAATVVALFQFVQTDDRKLLPVMGGLLLVAFVLSRDVWMPSSLLLPAGSPSSAWPARSGPPSSPPPVSPDG